MHLRIYWFHQHVGRREGAAEESCRFLDGSKEDAPSSSPSQDSYAHTSCQTCPEALYNRNTSFSPAQESSVKTETNTQQKTTIEEVEDEESTPLGHFQEPKRPEPFSSITLGPIMTMRSSSRSRDRNSETMDTWPKTTRSNQKSHSTIVKHSHQWSSRLAGRSSQTQTIHVQSYKENRSRAQCTDQASRSRKGDHLPDPGPPGQWLYRKLYQSMVCRGKEIILAQMGASHYGMEWKTATEKSHTTQKWRWLLMGIQKFGNLQSLTWDDQMCS